MLSEETKNTLIFIAIVIGMIIVITVRKPISKRDIPPLMNPIIQTIGE